ncbi:MAG: hypothetical protein CO141_02020 [Candidatus Moranbacteria bacterium CG_4_9_14_3_um_filter_42_9]|nr:MAG: hypothetical protein CO141_02020 [Candidatus Moranbacteria bacterium CG_4_9_14_3_um_filter_42_9]
MQQILNLILANKVTVILAAVVFLQLLWLIILQVSFRKLKKKTGDFNLGEVGIKIEAELAKQEKSIRALDKDVQELYNISNQINNLSLRGLHKVALIRFNPFKELGGDQSFSIALLNGKNNGIVISSLHTREGTRVYSKAIAGGKAEKYPLTEEEEQVVKNAMAQETKKIN